MDFKGKVNDMVKVPLGKYLTGNDLNHFDVAEQRDIKVCDGDDRTCNSPLYSIDNKGNLNITASDKTAGNYTLTEFSTHRVVFAFQLTLQCK